MTCRAIRHGNAVELRSPAFVVRLGVADGLRALSWENRLTGRVVELGNGPELQVDLDAAERRIWILGWHGMATGEGRVRPNADRGYLEGFHRAEFEDSKWPGHLNPPLLGAATSSQYYWVRTHVFLPPDCRSKPLSLVLGNLGLFDFRFLRVFVNGHWAGTRRVTDRWHEPGVFDLGPESKHHPFLRFGQDNVMVLQLAEPIRRTARLDELDPQAACQLPFINHYSPAFEQYLVVGRPLHRMSWSVERCIVAREGKAGEVVFELAERQRRLTARVRYRWAAKTPTLHKWVAIANASRSPARVMTVGLGTYHTQARVSEGEQGFPVYLDDDRFVGLAHPAGWAMGQHGQVELRQYPGTLLQPGESFDCMETVLGVAAKGNGRGAFLDHLRSRMRRVRRKHDKPRAIFEPFGGWPIAKEACLGYPESEKILLENLRKVNRGRREQDCRFDYYCLEFWADSRGDLERPHVELFPRGLAPVIREVRRGGMKLGLWLDNWCLCDNPVVSPSRSGDPAYHVNPEPGHVAHFLCLASEPARTIHETALRHHLRANGVRLLKLDSHRAICYNPAHDHLPGLYSIEAIHESDIGLLRALDAECADVFLMLYWGYRSPWWLLDADTLFEAGLAIEASSPAAAPTLFARDGVTQGLDQAQWFCHDVPPLGRDTLGVWLSDWPWNSCIGKERWQEGFVMDLCRGHLLAQPWGDPDWLTPVERRQMAEFLALLRSRPECFGNPRFILGNPWKNEPYGYCCTDGKRAFLALNNCDWKDSVVDLAALIATNVGGRLQRSHVIYRWYPNPARLVGDSRAIALRPFEVVLLEVVPQGQAPTLNRKFPSRMIPHHFAEPTVALELVVSTRKPKSLVPEDRKSVAAVPLQSQAQNVMAGPKRVLALAGRTPPSRRGGTLVIAAERSREGLAFQGNHPDREWELEAAIGGRDARPVPALKGKICPTAWQTWRIAAAASSVPRDFTCQIAARCPNDVRLRFSAHFIPKD